MPDETHWSPLHVAAYHGRLDAVNALLDRGFDVNTREQGDNTYAMHWAAAAGHLDVVQRLADAGGDVIGEGDDHEFGLIGWATCWDGCDDEAHRAVANFLLSRGARHHVFSAIAMNLAGEVRRIVEANPSALVQRMSRNENRQLPIHFAVRMNRPEMVTLLLDLGADPDGLDDAGVPPIVYAAMPNVSPGVVEALTRGRPTSLVAALMVRRFNLAEELLGGPSAISALPLLAKRGDALAVKWLLDHGIDPNRRWSHWGAMVTPLHLAALQGHASVVTLLLDAGADPTIRDSLHDGDAIGWAEHGGHEAIVRLVRAHERGA